MFQPIKVVDIELSRPIEDVEGLANYRAIKGLIRLHNRPLGYVDVPVYGAYCPAAAIRDAILEQHTDGIICYAVENGLTVRPGDSLSVNSLFDTTAPVYEGERQLVSAQPFVTVAVCTRNRSADLESCLAALTQLDYSNLEILVVDNAPDDDLTKQLVAQKYSDFRYVREPMPGLDIARNRAIAEAQGEIIAYTDDDVVVDSGWVTALVNTFNDDATVTAVTGLVVPYELESKAQQLFEEYGGFGRGFERRWVHFDPNGENLWALRGTGQFGTGANMAFRRTILEQIGGFDPALDVGTVTNGGGDLDMFFRVLKHGYTLVYEPSAIVRHRHRREYARLRQQIANNGVGLYAYFVRNFLMYRDERKPFLILGVWWFLWWHVRRLLLSFLRPGFPRELIWAEMGGVFKGVGRYQQARRNARENGIDSFAEPNGQKRPLPSQRKTGYASATRTIDLQYPLAALDDVAEYASVRLFIMWDGLLLGQVEIANQYRAISQNRLRDAIVTGLHLKLIAPWRTYDDDQLRGYLINAIAEKYALDNETIAPNQRQLPHTVSVSVVVATYDRPDDLQICLGNLLAQEGKRPLEIIIVDNNPSSGKTPPIVAQFPEVVLVNEPRQGLAYARNAGINASSGDIIVATDDDVLMPTDWLEKLVTPFAQNDVMIVTGNVLPAEIETEAQYRFEVYGGLGRGFEPKRVDGSWFEAFRLQGVPTWTLGATANAAFRATIFDHPEIGLMDEALGPGLPSGVGEDTYLFYKVLKAGFTLVYEPTAYVMHGHRRTLTALRRQLYNYSKGHVSYHLTTWLRDHDWRALFHIYGQLPLWNVKRLILWALRRDDYPLHLILLEMWGNLIGPIVLWRSRWRVWRQGRSQPYLPVRNVRLQTRDKFVKAQRAFYTSESERVRPISEVSLGD